MGTTDQGLVQRQADVIKEQDEVLAQIESGVGRLHEKVGCCLCLEFSQYCGNSGEGDW